MQLNYVVFIRLYVNGKLCSEFEINKGHVKIIIKEKYAKRREFGVGVRRKSKKKNPLLCHLT